MTTQHVDHDISITDNHGRFRFWAFLRSVLASSGLSGSSRSCHMPTKGEAASAAAVPGVASDFFVRLFWDLYVLFACDMLRSV